MARLKGFEELTNVDEALATFLQILKPKPLDPEKVLTREALGRVTAKAVYAQVPVPSFDRSAVDGYAVRATDTEDASQFAPKRLHLTEKNVLEKGEASKIWTGNPIPKGADAVVMLEYVTKIVGSIEVERSVTPGGNVAKKAEDLKKGELAIPAGRRLRPQHLGLLAALGINYVDVVKTPTMAILSTGKELVELGCETTGAYQIIDANKLILPNMCKELGLETIDLGIANDDVDEIASRIREGLKRSDGVITTGGTSVGYPDLVPIAVNQIGNPGVVAHGIAMRPGMSTALAVLQKQPVFILSGNPVAAAIGFEVFVRPFIFKLLGCKKEGRPWIKARLSQNVPSALGRRVFLRVKVVDIQGEVYARPIRIKGAGVLSTMTKANGYVVIPENSEGLQKNTPVIVYLFDSIQGTHHV